MVQIYKKSMELSLNLIIFLVIGLTVLGLVISFVTGFLGDASKSFSGQLGEDDKNKLDQVLNENGNLVIQPTTTNLKKGDSDPTKVYMKVRNVELSDPDISVGIEFSPGRGNDASSCTETNIETFMPPISLQSGQEGSYPIEIFAGSSVNIGTCYVKFTLNLDDTGDKAETQILTLNIQ